MKKFFYKIKCWFVLRWKELQSIQRDKKLMKTEREVRKVEFSKKHPVYTIATRVIAVLSALAVAIGFTCVSCRTMKDIQKQSTVTANAEDTPATPAGDLPIPQYLYFTPHITGMAYYSYLFDDVAYDFILPTYRLNTATCMLDGSYTFYDYRGSGSYDNPDAFWYNNLDSFVDDVWNVFYANYFGGMYLFDEYGVELNLVQNTGTRDIRSVSTYFSQSVVGTYEYYVYHIDIICGDGINAYEWLVPLYYDPSVDPAPLGEEGVSIPACNILIGYEDYPGLYNSYQLFWNDGYNYGQSLSGGAYLEGYNTGYDEGYIVGDSVGYNRGLSESLADVTPWEVIVDGVNHFFSLSFLGNSITIGMVLSVGFGCILIGFAIKIFLGG